MSGGDREPYHHPDLFFNNDLSTFSTIFAQRPSDKDHVIEPPPVPIMNFDDYGSFERAFDLPSPLHAFGAWGEKTTGDKVTDSSTGTIIVNGEIGVIGALITPNSSVSWSSKEAADHKDSGRCKKDQLMPKEEVQQHPPKGDGNGGERSRKMSEPRKKGEKRLREPSFAFLTVSEVDILEDGYRWRKYGQKAVKDSHYPRSYYRCTTQKCSVKKRVERSFQDPKTVITTYEGQHTHHSPATIRGGLHMLAPQPAVSSSLLGYPLITQCERDMGEEGPQRRETLKSWERRCKQKNVQQILLSVFKPENVLEDVSIGGAS